MTHRRISSTFLIITCIGLLIWFFLYVNHLKNTPESNKIRIHNLEINVERADTDEKRTRGLSGRKVLSENTGMLFIFPVKGVYPFWMHGMFIPLDFIWIDGNTVVDLTENVPPPLDPKSTSIPLYAPNKQIDKVLEVNAGFIQKKGIRIGDVVK